MDQLLAAPGHTGTLFQFYIAATQGGVALPDSLNISPPANLGSFICTLPILMHDPHLAPILQEIKIATSGPHFNPIHSLKSTTPSTSSPN